MNDILTNDQGRAPGLYDEQLQRQQQEKLLIRERKLSVHTKLMLFGKRQPPVEA